MNKVYKIVITTLTATLISVSAFASPHHQTQQSAWQQQQSYKSQSHQHPAQNNLRQSHQHNKWQTQQKLPKIYQNSHYKVSSYQHHQLSKPNRDQQWYKVDGYYLLTNTKSNTIVKIVKA